MSAAPDTVPTPLQARTAAIPRPAPTAALRGLFTRPRTATPRPSAIPPAARDAVARLNAAVRDLNAVLEQQNQQ